MAEHGSGVYHLVVLVHGFMGFKSDFDHFMAIAKECFVGAQPGTVRFHAVSCNSSLRKTFDGIEAGGTRVADEVEALANTLDGLQSVSFVGHSLGGIYIRWAVHVLRVRGFFGRIKPVNYVTLATPHIGIRRKSKDFFLSKAAFNYGIGIFGLTGRELYLDDSKTAPLLYKMTGPDFLADIEMFERRLLYSNVYNDVMVSYRSAAIRTHNPYIPKGDGAYVNELAIRPDALVNDAPAGGCVANDGGSDLTAAKRTSSVRSLSTLTGAGQSEVDTLTEYPHISQLSQEAADMLLEAADSSQYNLVDTAFIDKAFASDKHRDMLREMLRRLQALVWVRFDVVFVKGLQPFAHEQIIAKNEFLHSGAESGEDVVRHVLSRMLWPP